MTKKRHTGEEAMGTHQAGCSNSEGLDGKEVRKQLWAAQAHSSQR